MEDRELRIETPVGTVVSDSGNHFVDFLSVVGIIVIFFFFKKIAK